MKLTMIV